MSDYSAAMTTARMQLVLLRLQATTLAILVEQEVLEPAAAATLVRDAAAFLPSPTNSPEVEKLLIETLEQTAKQLEEHRRG